MRIGGFFGMGETGGAAKSSGSGSGSGGRGEGHSATGLLDSDSLLPPALGSAEFPIDLTAIASGDEEDAGRSDSSPTPSDSSPSDSSSDSSSTDSEADPPSTAASSIVGGAGGESQARDAIDGWGWAAAVPDFSARAREGSEGRGESEGEVRGFAVEVDLELGNGGGQQHLSEALWCDGAGAEAEAERARDCDEDEDPQGEEGAGPAARSLGYISDALESLQDAVEQYEENARQRHEAAERSLFREMDFVRTMLRRIRFRQTSGTGADQRRADADARFFELVRRKFLASWEDSFLDVLSLQPYQMVFLANLLDLPAIRDTGDRPTSAGLFPAEEDGS